MKSLHYQLCLFCISSIWTTFGFLIQHPKSTTSTSASHYTTITRSTTLHETNTNNREYTSITTPNPKEGIYRPFLNYAWEKLSSSGLITNDGSTTMDDDSKSSAGKKNSVIQNSSPSKGSGIPDGTVVNVEIQSVNGINGVDNNDNGKGSLRLARYAILETMTPSSLDDDRESNMISLHQGIHVLNLVLFPSINKQNPIPLPILGMDLVTLPGGKHLIAIDFQPILPLQDDHNEHTFLFPQHSDATTIQSKYETKIKTIHDQYVKQHPNEIIWGGDIPQPAKRFFSPYALWTRLKDDDGLDIIQNQIYIAFCAYFDLYIELLQEIQNDNESDNNNDGSSGKDDGNNHEEEAFEKVKNGHRDYLTYRKENDPARPMLTRLYGNDWTEDIISEVLFKMI